MMSTVELHAVVNTLSLKKCANFGKLLLRQAWFNVDNFRSTAEHSFKNDMHI